MIFADRVKLPPHIQSIYSNNLMSKIKEEKCQGDFCDFVGMKQIKFKKKNKENFIYLFIKRRIRRTTLFEIFNK